MTRHDKREWYAFATLVLGLSTLLATTFHGENLYSGEITRARALVVQADSLYDAGEWARAATLYEQIAVLNRGDSESLGRLAASYYYLGEYDHAIEAYQLAVASSTPGSRAQYLTMYNLACAYALAGQKVLAIEMLQQAVDAGYENGGYILGDSDFDNIRDEQGFQDILVQTFGAGYTGFAESGPTSEQMREGIALLVKTIQNEHPNPYRHFSREEWHEHARAARDNVEALDEAGYYAELCRLAGLVGDVHTSVYPRRDSSVLKYFYNIALWYFKDGLYIRAAGPPYERLVGAKVLALQGVPIDKAWARLIDWLPTENKWMSWYTAAYHIQFPEYLRALGLGNTDKSSQMTLLKSGGERENVDLVATNSSGYLGGMNVSLGWRAPDTWREGHDDLRKPPLWLQNRTRNYFYEFLDEQDAIYMQFNIPRYDSDHPYQEFLNEMFGFIRDSDKVDKLIIDLRLNPGGWDYMIQALLQGIVQTPKINKPGHLYVLMGRLTQSAGVTFVVKLAPATHAVFVGEPVGAHPNYYNGPWGNHPSRALPGTDIVFRVSTILEQHSDPIDNRHYIAPDIEATMTYEDYATGRDPALEAALSLSEDEAEAFFQDAGGRDTPLYLHWRRPSQALTYEHR